MYFTLYSMAYYGALTILLVSKKINFFNSKEVLIKSLLAIAILSFDGTFTIHIEFIQNSLSLNLMDAKYLTRLINQSFPTIVYCTGIIFLWKKYDSSLISIYGFSSRNFYWKPYLIMLLFMIPLLGIASFQNDFIQQYPFFKYWNCAPAFGLSQKQMFAIYEFFYLFNFINVEVLFRGLLVIGMIKCMGTNAVLPMIIIYTFLHFGKPPAETISSALGGYILGIIAFRTENIFGGFLIHICIAFLMDLFAILQTSSN